MRLTDRSRHFLGLQQCQHARYLGYVAEGGGIEPLESSLPLSTGSGLHEPLAELLRWAQAHGGLPPESMVRAVEQKHIDAYQKGVKAGLQGVASEELDFVIKEQSHLIGALLWAFWRVSLPWILSEYVVVEVETEHDYVIGCSCGLGDAVGLAADHEFRGCSGVCIMIRPDFALKNKKSGALEVWDFKTTSWGLEQKEYEQSLQMSLGCLAVEKDLGEPVRTYRMVGLLKGQRKASPGESLKKQQTVLCYDYCLVLPGRDVQWNFGYTKAKGFRKVPIWEAAPRGSWTAAEWWTGTMPKELLAEQIQILPPMMRPDWLIPGFLTSFLSEELRWQELEKQIAAGGEVDWLAPKSWGCFGKFGVACQFLSVCRKEAGWEHPLSGGRWKRRVPNHLLEKGRILKKEGVA